MPSTVALSPRDPLALSAYALGVATPGSPLYRHYLSVAEFAARFGPTDAQIAQVQASLRDHGLDPGPPLANHLSIPVRATAQRVRSAFSTQLERYALPHSGTAFANTAPPSFDARIARYIQGVIGLSTLQTPKPRGIRAVPGRSPRAVAPKVVTGGPQPCAAARNAAAKLGAGYTADQVANAYRFSPLYAAGDFGAGQTVALYELESFAASDISTYQSCYGTSANVTNVNVDGGSTDAGSGESVLDIETIVGLAPQARVLVYTGPNAASGGPGAGPYDTYAAIISENRAKVVSTSWGLCEPLEGSDALGENTLFQEAAAQGQSIFAATGDSGASDCLSALGASGGALAVDDPASQPFVTGVGGTSLQSTGPPPSEAGWPGSGGGISALWSMPDYQSAAAATLGVVNASSSSAPCGSAPTPCRQVPDVASDAAPATGYLIYFTPDGWAPIGGTSVGAPTWAALFALANGSPACTGRPVGFANPALYRIAGNAYASTFNDVVIGSNAVTGAGGYTAKPGYDMVTGLGTPIAAPLVSALCDRVTALAPANQSSVAGLAATLRISAASAAGAALRFSATGLPRGLSIDAGTGVISGQPSSIGTSPVTVTIVDSLGQSATVSFLWTVRAATVILTNPGTQSTLIAHRARLQLRASSNSGQAPSYLATGLPRGLSLNVAAGLITGTPSRVGRFTVTIGARAGSGAARTTFLWVVAGPPAAAAVQLSGLTHGAPRLSFAVASGRNGAPVRALAIRSSSSISFAARPGAGITVTDASGHRLGFTARSVHGVLTVTLKRPVSRLRVAIGPRALHVSRGLTAQVASHRAPRLVLRVDALDTARQTTRLTLRVRPR